MGNKEKMNKKCYGVIFTIDGKQEYLYEDPYAYIERVGCKPISNYFEPEFYDEDLPIHDPHFVYRLSTNFNIMFYSKDGKQSDDQINEVMTKFCNIYAFNSTPRPLSYIDYVEELVRDDAIILPRRDKFMYAQDAGELQFLLNTMERYLPKDKDKYIIENMSDEELENMGIDIVEWRALNKES